MKTTLLFLILTFSFFSKAQTWCPSGAVWHHTFTPAPSNPRTGVVEDKYVGDTLLGGKQCKIIKEVFTGRASDLSPVYSSSATMIYSYLENGVLFLHNGGMFDTLVNFNSGIGDKWLRNSFLSTNCNSRRTVTVIDTGRVLINNFSLKKIVTTYTSSYTNGNSTVNVVVNDTLIDRMMTTYDYLFPVFCERDNFYDFGLLTKKGKLICYQDDKFGSYKNAGYESCEYITSVGEISNGDIAISLYPNPVVNDLKIQIKKSGNYTLHINDLPGKQLAEINVEGGSHLLNLSHLDKGIYFVTLSNDNGLLLTQKLIKH